MKAPQEIFALVARFEQNLEAYQSGKYNETQIRREFIDPFFKVDRKSTRLNSSHTIQYRMPSSA